MTLHRQDCTLAPFQAWPATPGAPGAAKHTAWESFGRPATGPSVTLARDSRWQKPEHILIDLLPVYFIEHLVAGAGIELALHMVQSGPAVVFRHLPHTLSVSPHRVFVPADEQQGQIGGLLEGLPSVRPCDGGKQIPEPLGGKGKAAERVGDVIGHPLFVPAQPVKGGAGVFNPPVEAAEGQPIHQPVGAPSPFRHSAPISPAPACLPPVPLRMAPCSSFPYRVR